MSPWKEDRINRLPLPDGRELTVELRGVPARHRDLWILVHGLGGSRQAPLARYLVRRLRETAAVVAVPDLPGHGDTGSDPAELNLSTGQMALDAVHERWAARAGRVFLLAFSYGGWIAAWFATRTPVAGLVLGGAALYHHELLREHASPAAWQAAMASGRLEVEMGGNPMVVGREALAEGETHTPERLARELRCPGLLVHGREDRVIPWEDSVRFHRACTGPLELAVLPAAPHTFLGAEPELFERVRSFHRGVRRRG